MHKDDLGDSDEEELKHEKPILNAEQANELRTNVFRAMSASQAIAKDIEGPEALHNDTLEMILYLTQRAISDLKEINQ